MDRLRRRSDAFSGVALVVLSIAYGLGARGLAPGVDEPGPAFFPEILAAVLAVLGIGIAGRGIAGGYDARAETSVGAGELRPLLLAAASFAFVWSFELLGAVPATLAFTTAIVLFFRNDRARQNWWVIAVVPLATTAILYAIFAGGLGVPLPSGALWP